MPLFLEQITAAKLGTLAKDKTVFFFPVGPIEDHGPHLPLGLDGMEAEKLCSLTALRLESELPGWTAILMPRVPLGIDSHTSALAITVRGHVLRDWLVDSCLSLHRSGFTQFVCFTGNAGPRQLTAIEEAGKLLRQKTRRFGPFSRFAKGPQKDATLVSASSAALEKAEASVIPFWALPSEHGGERDTSIALSIAPESVDPLYQSLPTQAPVTPLFSRFIAHRKYRLKGYWGSPAQATVESGSARLTEKVNQIFPKLRAVWEGANPQSLFRSWFSIYPTNKSFFKAWLMALALCILLSVWVYTNLQSLVRD
ncbi:MAG: creatininase family protein [Methylotenera sp.]|nr:creatininase family protein [Oligoflexia bacterium]